MSAAYLTRQRGFLQFLLGNPLLLACAALGIALIFAGLGLKFWKSRADHWQAQHSAVKAEFAGFVEAVKKRGEEQEAETAKTVKAHQEALREAKERFRVDLARRDADLRRLRERAPTDPGGRELPTIACGPAGTDGARQEHVSLAAYRALEERAYDDARTLTQLQEWVRKTGHREE
jgi:hypothetical protein